MFGSALYYPTVDIDDRKWLKTAILFWDNIQTIVPESIEEPYRNSDTRLCAEEGFLRPLRPGLHPALLKTLGEHVRDLIVQSNTSIRLRREAGLSSSAAARNIVLKKLHQSHLYPEKLSPELRDMLVEIGFAELRSHGTAGELDRLGRLIVHAEYDRTSRRQAIDMAKRALKNEIEKAAQEGDVLLVNNEFADLYMTSLANVLARDQNLVPLASMRANLNASVESLICGAGGHESDAATGVLLEVTLESLKIDPKIPTKKLLTFRRKREEQLAQLAGAFDNLKSGIKDSEDNRELKRKAARIVKNQIRPELTKLKRELRDNGIQSIWGAAATSAMLSVSAGSALAAVVPHNLLLGAGAFINVASIAVGQAFARRKARANSRYTYLLDVERKFALPA